MVIFRDPGSLVDLLKAKGVAKKGTTESAGRIEMSSRVFIYFI